MRAHLQMQSEKATTYKFFDENTNSALTSKPSRYGKRKKRTVKFWGPSIAVLCNRCAVAHQCAARRCQVCHRVTVTFLFFLQNTFHALKI